MDYSGRIVTKNAVTPSQTSASGVWNLQDQILAQQSNTWPVPGVYNPISRSLRFNSADSAYLSRTPASAGNRRTFTFSVWAKISALSARRVLFGTGDTSLNNSFEFEFYSDDKLRIANYVGGIQIDLTTTALYRDVSAWYHLVMAVDTTQATDTNRVKLYVNGTQVTSFSTATYPSQNFDTALNTTSAVGIGRAGTYNAAYYNGYLTEVNFIDGQALTPSSFGTTDPQTGVWVPVAYTGTYGTNGFYLNFKDNTSTTTIGYDYSGNGNNWTTNNFSVSPGVGNDSLTDVPTPWLPYNTAGDIGGVVRGNYCTLNPLSSTGSTLSNGNLDCVTATSGGNGGRGTIAVTTGKWYWEFTPTNNGGQSFSGIALTTTADASYYVAYYANTGNKYIIGSGSSAYGATYTTNDVIGVALDLDSGTKTVTFYKNNVSQGAITITPSDPVLPIVDDGSGSATVTFSCNFGQRPFAYTPPSGYKSLCTTNLPTPTIGATASTQANKYFDATLYTGTSASQSITNAGGFQPDLVWVKSRSAATDNKLTDAVRGTTKALVSNSTAAETTDTNGLTAFNSNGFTIGSDSVYNNGTGPATYVGWQWNAGGSNATNTSGSITSTVRANTTAGFSIVTYTGTGANATVGHGLGVAPAFVIIKKRNNTGTAYNWWCWHSAFVTAGGNDFIVLNTTSAKGSGGPVNSWNDTVPSSTVISLGSYVQNNNSGDTFVAYCFAAVAGYSAFGSYTGNGSTDGPFVYTGFRPRYVMVKDISQTNDWELRDTSRSPYNAANARLYPNASYAENTGGDIDILSNGFKVRMGAGSGWNISGNIYIYAAFAESPFKFSNAR